MIGDQLGVQLLPCERWQREVRAMEARDQKLFKDKRGKCF